MSPDRLLRTWRSLAGRPGGRWLFARLLGWFVPYTGSIGARVESLEPGSVTVSLRDRRAVRNHLGSVHAIALANLAEVTSGLAMLSGIGPGVRGIPTAIQIDFVRKARGRLLATSRVTPPPVTEPVDADVTAQITNANGETVATAVVTWRLSPI